LSVYGKTNNRHTTIAAAANSVQLESGQLSDPLRKT
jgi:hypothetical protein